MAMDTLRMRLSSHINCTIPIERGQRESCIQITHMNSKESVHVGHLSRI